MFVYRTRGKFGKFHTFNAALDDFKDLPKLVDSNPGGVIIAYDIYNIRVDATHKTTKGAHSVMLRKHPDGTIYFYDINCFTPYKKVHKGAIVLDALIRMHVDKVDMKDRGLHEYLCSYAEARSSDPLGACSFYCEGAQKLW